MNNNDSKAEPSNMENGDSYDSSSIRVLEGVEGVRKRPGMYIGSVGSRGLHHLIFEVVDNSVDEGLANFADTCEVVLLPQGYVSSTDNGRGIPSDKHPKFGISSLEVIMTHLHSGGKFDNKVYKVSGGLHGVGLTVVNALSEHMIVEVIRDNKYYTQEYRKGIKTTEVLESELTENVINSFFYSKNAPKTTHGTKITFRPDPEIFEVTNFDFETLSGRLQELAFLTPNMKFILLDKRGEQEKEVIHHYEGGIREFVKYLMKIKNAEYLIGEEKIFFTSTKEEGVQVDLGLTWNTTYSELIMSFANNISTHEGGSHISGFRTGLTRTLNEYGKKKGILNEKTGNVEGEYFRKGLIAVISVKVPDPTFEGQTKTKLMNSSVERIVQRVVSQELATFLENESKLAKEIIQKALQERKLQADLKKKLELSRQQAQGRVSLPGKLIASREKDPLKRELFLVEGQSAGGTAVKARDSQFQEILFLRGKVLNVEKAHLGKALENQEIRNIISAIGAGIQYGQVDDEEKNEHFDINKARYGKIIILTDADVDGAHIETLLLTLFFRYMRPLVEQGRIFVARPPLFRVSLRGKVPPEAKELIGKKGYKYFHTEEEKDKLVDELLNLGVPMKNIMIQRYKGLGEMNPDQLEETAMNPETRRIERLVIENDLQAENTFSILMGDDVSARKKFIADQVFKEEVETVLDEGIADEYFESKIKDETKEDLDEDTSGLKDDFEDTDETSEEEQEMYIERVLKELKEQWPM